MERFDLTPEHATKLREIQRRARDLVKQHPQVREWLRDAFDHVVRHYREERVPERLTNDLVHEILEDCVSTKSGRLPLELKGYSLRSPQSRGRAYLPCRFEVILPRDVLALIEGIETSDDSSRDTKLVAAAVLASGLAMKDPRSLEWIELKALEGNGAATRGMFAVDVPFEPSEPDPTQIDDYSRLAGDIQRSAGLYFLSGLIDLGATHTVIPKPEDTDDGDSIPEHCWYSRFPIIFKREHLAPRPSSLAPGVVSPAVQPDPWVLDPDLAEQWLESLEMRVALEPQLRRDEPQPPSAPASSAEPDMRELRQDPHVQRDLLQSLEHIARRPGAAQFLRKALDDWERLFHADTKSKAEWYPKFERYRDAVLAGNDTEPIPPEPSAVWTVQPSANGAVWKVLDEPSRLAIAAARLIGHAVAMRCEWTEELAPTGSAVHRNMAICSASVRIADAWTYLDLLAYSTQNLACGPSPKQAKRRRGKGVPTPKGMADRVRRILSAVDPFEGTQLELAREVGYTQPSSLRSVKNFDAMWAANKSKVAERKAEAARRMRGPI